MKNKEEFGLFCGMISQEIQDQEEKEEKEGKDGEWPFSGIAAKVLSKESDGNSYPYSPKLIQKNIDDEDTFDLLLLDLVPGPPSPYDSGNENYDTLPDVYDRCDKGSSGVNSEESMESKVFNNLEANLSEEKNSEI
jgi:hypothetical protein